MLATAACVLPPAAAVCYICCHHFLCENHARGRLGLETILGRVFSNQFIGRVGRSLEHEAASFTRGKNPIGVVTKGAIEWGDAHACCTLTPQIFLDYYRLPDSVEPLTPLARLVPADMQDSSLSHNEFALCLRSLLRPSSALPPCEFAKCMRALFPSPIPACLRSLLRPSLALSLSEFKSLYMRALTATHVPAGFRMSGSRPGQPAWLITELTTRVFRRPLLLPTPRVIEYSDDIVFLFHPPHLLYHLPAPLPDNSIMIVIAMSVSIVLLM